MTSSDARVPARAPLLPPDLLRDREPSRLGTALYALSFVLVAFYDLTGRSIFHHDVPRFATIAGEMVRSRDWLVPTQFGETYANKPILYVWLVAATSAIVGEAGALATRLPSALALLATGWATALWTRARTGSVALGRTAALVAITTYSLHRLGRTGRPDMLAAACSTIAAALADRAIARGSVGARASPRTWTAIGLALGAGLLAKGPVVVVLPFAVALLPRRGTTLRARHRLVRLDLAVLVALGVAALWLVPAGLHGGTGYLRRLVVDQVAERVRGEGNYREPVWYYLGTAPAAWLPWSPLLLGVAGASISRRVRDRIGAAAPLGAALAGLVVLSAIPTKEVRYAAILVPPLAVALAQALGAWAAAASDDDAPSPARVHLLVAGIGALLATAAVVVAEVRVPAAALLLTPIALLLLGTGAGAIRRACGAVSTRAVRGRLVGLAVIVAACGACAYWVVLGRYLGEHSADAENRALADVLDPSLPVVLVGAPRLDGLTPDDVVVGAPAVRFVRSAARLAAASVPRGAQVIALERDRAAIEAVLGPMRRVLDRPRRDGGALLVLRAAP